MRREYVTKKYVKLRDDKIKIDGTTLYRIVAVENFGDVRAGELGGYIQTVKNLSQEGNCWVYDKAIVKDYAFVGDDATVRGNSMICGNALVVHKAQISGNAVICNGARIYGNAKVCQHGYVEDKASVYDNAVISGNAIISENAIVCGDAKIFGPHIISENGFITNNTSCISIGPITDNEYKYITLYLNNRGHILCRIENCVIPIEQLNVIINNLPSNLSKYKDDLLFIDNNIDYYTKKLHCDYKED